MMTQMFILSMYLKTRPNNFKENESLLKDSGKTAIFTGELLEMVTISYIDKEKPNDFEIMTDFLIKWIWNQLEEVRKKKILQKIHLIMEEFLEKKQKRVW